MCNSPHPTSLYRRNSNLNTVQHQALKFLEQHGAVNVRLSISMYLEKTGEDRLILRKLDPAALNKVMTALVKFFRPQTDAALIDPQQ